MPRSDACWGIDIGQCAMKALRCRRGDEPGQIVADAFDYIEYPKILSQPEANPEELIRDAIKQFLSRNKVRFDRVAISVSGQSGLARFIKLPPVEMKRIPDIVKYEAKQQIPFSLDEVIWDYQRLAGGMIEEGFALETEVGLFAMKRDQVFRALKPFEDAGVEVDFIQLTPLALYNFAVFDQMPELPSEDLYDPDNPPESVVVLSLGTDTTDLVITNGYRVWQRSIPIGGSHFTKVLTKELKVTFAAAEHKKRNAAQADDPKALFQAMRTVFSDLLQEVQRSINYFSNLDRKAKLARGIALGNAMKLPGLQKYLAQNLGFELQRLDSFRGLKGPAVVDAPVFKENLPAFGVCYGLCVQGLNEARLRTNLLPKEIATDRLIREKRPWAVGAAAALLLGLGVNFFSDWRALASVEKTRFEPAMNAANTVVNNANTRKTEHDQALGQFKSRVAVGEQFLRNFQGSSAWLDMYKAVGLCLPRDAVPPPEDIGERDQIHVTSMEAVFFPKLEDWYKTVKPEYERDQTQLRESGYLQSAAPAAEGGTETANGAQPSAGGQQPSGDKPAEDPGPTGPGWVIQLRGYHYHNVSGSTGAQYVRTTLLYNLLQPEVPVPGGAGPLQTFPVGSLGIRYPALIEPGEIDKNYMVEVVRDVNASGAEGEGEDGATADGASGDSPDAQAPGQGAPGDFASAVGMTVEQRRQPRFDFVLQFCWALPTTEGEQKQVILPRITGSLVVPGTGLRVVSAEEQAAAESAAAAVETVPDDATDQAAPPVSDAGVDSGDVLDEVPDDVPPTDDGAASEDALTQPEEAAGEDDQTPPADEPATDAVPADETAAGN